MAKHQICAILAAKLVAEQRKPITIPGFVYAFLRGWAHSGYIRSEQQGIATMAKHQICAILAAKLVAEQRKPITIRKVK